MKNIQFYVLLTVSSFMMACDNFVEVDLPESLLTGAQVFEDPNTVRAALGNIYSKLRDEGILCGKGSGAGTAFGLYSDELINYDLNGSASDNIYNNAILASNPSVQDYWNASYHQIYCANAIIEGVDSSKGLVEKEKNIFKGEALFIRALVHFYLVNIFRKVPYITTTNTDINKSVSRNEVQYVYDLIIDDLIQSQELLSNEYTNTERTIPNRSAAMALLARVYLYNKNWAEAANSASAVLNNSKYTLDDDLNSIFLKESTSTIWQFKPGSSRSNAYEAGTYIFTTLPPPSISLKNKLIAAFEPGDNRRQNWIGEISDQGTIYYYPHKYKQNVTTGTSLEYSVVLRLAEQYLIRSEARAHQGDLIGALQDLNTIRNKAGLGDSTAENVTTVLAAISHERQIEFFTEYGHRFFDLKRTGKLDQLNSSKPGWDNNDILWPLPETELLSNPALAPQNPGY